MARARLYIAPDDAPLYVLKRDLSGGQNTRNFEQNIQDNQAVLLQNVLLDTQGNLKLREGQTRVDDTYPVVSGAGTGLFGFDPDGGTFELLATQKTNLSGWPTTGTFSNYKTDFTTGLQTTMIKAGMLTQNDIVLVSNGTDNVFAMYQDHTMHDLGDTNTSPPKTTALAWYGNRVWALKSNLAYFSDAFPSSYATAFDRTTNAFRVPVGTARSIIPTRDQGLIFIGADQIWQMAPSIIPDPTTDFPQKVLDIGCVNGNTAIQVADDILFLCHDGVRGLFRTQLDKLQTGQSYPLSYVLQDEVNSINWQHIDTACAVYFDNKYIISIATGNSTHNNSVWVYYPYFKAWAVYDGWNIARFAKLRIDGQEVLYGIDSVTGKVYKLFSGTDDDGKAIVFDYVSRAEDFGAPMQYKFGGEFKVRSIGGGGTLVVLANQDGQGWVQLGTMDLGASGVVFPITFPADFRNENEIVGEWHLDNAGIKKFKRVKFEIYCDDADAQVTIIESLATAFQEPYLSEQGE